MKERRSQWIGDSGSAIERETEGCTEHQEVLISAAADDRRVGRVSTPPQSASHIDHLESGSYRDCFAQLIADFATDIEAEKELFVASVDGIGFGVQDSRDFVALLDRVRPIVDRCFDVRVRAAALKVSTGEDSEVCREGEAFDKFEVAETDLGGDRFVLVETEGGTSRTLAWASVWDDEAARDGFVARMAPAFASGLGGSVSLTSLSIDGRPGALLIVGSDDGLSFRARAGR